MRWGWPMAHDRIIPVPLSPQDADHFLSWARSEGVTVPELLRAILETVAEDGRAEGFETLAEMGKTRGGA